MKKYDILCLPPQEKPIYFIVESHMGDDAKVNAYRFEEGDCPINFFLRGVETIIADGDPDPHGLFEHVRSFTEADAPFLGRGHIPEEEWPKILPEAFPPR
jgi:hypothetical protein